MFGRSKAKAPGASVAPEHKVANPGLVHNRSPAAGPANGKSPAATGAAAPNPPNPASPNQAVRQRAAIAVRNSLAFAQIVSLLMRSAQHKRYPIAALEWLVIPPLLTGQFSVAEARSNQNGASAPVAVALWASVSPEVDKRLSEDLGKPMQLRPREWRSGEIVWLVAAVGAPRVLPQFLRHLSETTFKGREVKVLRRDTDGKATVGSLAGLIPSS